ncbi:MAG: transcriptional repressor [Prevotellaceae bacterium]|nr:transcriptional repressor [Prevotellaceae bacterium]
MNEKYIQKLESNGIKATAIRLLVWRTMKNCSLTFSLGDLEGALETVDKSTISRTIRLFLEHKMIHSIDDGSGAMKYAVCNDECDCSINDLHIHFHCRQCGKTCCFEQVAIPEFSIPNGFVAENVNLVVKGICNVCAKFATKLH